MNEHVNLMVQQYELGADQDGEFIRFTGGVCENIHGGLQERKVDIKSIKQYAQPGKARRVVNLFKEYTRSIPETGQFYRKPLESTEPGDIGFGKQPVGINTSKYLRSMCIAAKIDMEGRRFSNHYGKVTCATRL